MTVSTSLAYIAACALILHGANHADYRRGWYERPSFPRCLR